MNKRTIYNGVSACLCGALFSLACVEQDDDYDDVDARNAEIVESLLAAGYAPETIEIREAERVRDDLTLTAPEPQVFLDGDIHVTLEASRELTSGDKHDGFRMWRAPNLVNSGATICLAKITAAQPPYASFTLTSDMQIAVDRARDNFNVLHSFNLDMVSGDGWLDSGGLLTHGIPGCSYSIFIYQVAGTPGGQSGFPANGAPYSQVRLRSGLSSLSLDAHEHVATHEISHAIGLRHSDWKTRSSCWQNVNEGHLGAVQIPGTDDQTTDSIMASCFKANTDGEFRGQDEFAFNTLY